MAEQQKASEKKKEGKKEKISSALKRDLQNEKRRLRNRSFESKVHTAIRGFEKALSEKAAPDVVKTKLSTIFSLMDKGVKKGVYKVQKASRTKSRLTARSA